jgi:hypothetical protein
MSAAHYGLSTVIAASLSLSLVGCGSSPPPGQANAPKATPSAANLPVAQADPPGEMDTEASIWTLLGIARKPSVHQPGPQTGNTVSPILWQAAHDALDFVKFSAEDPLTGLIVTDWYSPKDKPDERFRITVFVLSRTLRSDSLAVTVDRQQRSQTGEWVPTTVARKAEDALETTILRRAGQLKREWQKEWAAE